MRAASILALGLCGHGLLACSRDEPAPSSSEPAPPPASPASPTSPTPPPEPTAPGEADANSRVAADVGALTIPARLGWSSEYDAALESFAVYKPSPDAGAPADRFYVDAFPSDAPTELETYAAKLTSDPSFQADGYLFVDIERKQAVEGGWLVVGSSKDTSDDASEAGPSFVLLRAAAGVYCHSGTFVDAKSRDEAIEICMGIAPAAAARP